MKSNLNIPQKATTRNLRSALETIKTRCNYIAAWLLADSQLATRPHATPFESDIVTRICPASRIAKGVKVQRCPKSPNGPASSEYSSKVKRALWSSQNSSNNSREFHIMSLFKGEAKTKELNGITRNKYPKRLGQERMGEIFKSSTLRLSWLEPVMLNNFLLFINDFWFSSCRFLRSFASSKSLGRVFD